MILSRLPTEVSFLHKVKIVHRDIKPFPQKWWCRSISGKPVRWKKYVSSSIQSRALMCFSLRTKYQKMHHLNRIDLYLESTSKANHSKKLLPLFYHRPWLPLSSPCPTWIQPRTENFLLLGDVGSTEGVFFRSFTGDWRRNSDVIPDVWNFNIYKYIYIYIF